MTQIGPKVFSAQAQGQALVSNQRRFAGTTKDSFDLSGSDDSKGRRKGRSSQSENSGSFFPASLPVAMRRALEQVDRLLHS